MKMLILICVLFLMGCYVHIPAGVKAQMTVDKFLDTLNLPNKVEEKIGLGFTTIKDYLRPSTRKKFQNDDAYYHLGASGWDIFTKKVTDILSKEKGGIKGMIIVEGYKVNWVQYTTAFFVDSSFRKVFATIPLSKWPVPTKK